MASFCSIQKSIRSLLAEFGIQKAKIADWCHGFTDSRGWTILRRSGTDPPLNCPRNSPWNGFEDFTQGMGLGGPQILQRAD